MIQLKEGWDAEGHMRVLGFIEAEGVVDGSRAGDYLDFNCFVGLLIALKNDNLDFPWLNERA